MTGDVEIVRFDGPDAKKLHPDVVDIYRSVFTRPPFDDSEREVGWFDQEFGSDVDHPEFRCFAARAGGAVVGFAYGFRTFDSEPWNDWYAEVLRAVGPAAADTWIRGQCAVGWLAVHEQHRRQGIGGRLYDELLASAGPTRWWLVTHDLDTPARRLYRRRGWVELGRGPLGWRSAERLVLGLERQSPAAPSATGPASVTTR
jgi:ribosomal protein S18 acetylase RimI-like enzyme